MKPFSINKTQFKILYNSYNNNENSMVLTHRTEINQALELCDKHPDLFFANRLDFLEYNFHIKDLENTYKILKYNSKFEKDYDL